MIISHRRVFSWISVDVSRWLRSKRRKRAWRQAIQQISDARPQPESLLESIALLGSSGPEELRPFLNRCAGAAALVDLNEALRQLKAALDDSTSDAVIDRIVASQGQEKTFTL